MVGNLNILKKHIKQFEHGSQFEIASDGEKRKHIENISSEFRIWNNTVTPVPCPSAKFLSILKKKKFVQIPNPI